MNIIPYFACVAIGIAISETYHFRNKIAEQKAYDRGFKRGHRQALKETTETVQATEEQTETPKRRMRVITEDFMDQLHANGKAVIKLGGVNNE